MCRVPGTEQTVLGLEPRIACLKAVLFQLSFMVLFLERWHLLRNKEGPTDNCDREKTKTYDTTEIIHKFNVGSPCGFTSVLKRPGEN